MSLSLALADALEFLRNGGPSMAAIAALSVAALGLILWKLWRFSAAGIWRGGRGARASAALAAGRVAEAEALVAQGGGARGRILRGALHAARTLPEEAAREDAARLALTELDGARAGLRGLELIAAIAPLLGLLGTVLGMISAFQALQEAGARADPSALAGGIWEALLTTAAGMAAAIPASAALTWFESVIERLRRDAEDAVSAVFVEPKRRAPAAQAVSAPASAMDPAMAGWAAQ